MTDPVSNEIRDLLAEIRDLLLPVADAYRDEYEKRLAQREAERQVAVQELLKNPKRARAWKLADGSRTQSEIAKQASMDLGNTSRFFKRLRELKAVTGSSKPTRIELQNSGR